MGWGVEGRKGLEDEGNRKGEGSEGEGKGGRGWVGGEVKG